MDIDPAGTYIIAGLVISFSTSFFFSLIKIIFSATDKNSIPSDNERLRYYAAKIEDILEDSSRLRNSISFAKTASNTFFSMLTYFAFLRWYPMPHQYQTAIVASIIAILSLSFLSYIVSRAIALHFHHNLYSISYIIYSIFFKIQLMPFSIAMNMLHQTLLSLFGYDEKLSFLSEDEKSRLNLNANDDETLDSEEREMIRGIFELGETTVEEIMRPRVDIQALDVTTNYAKALHTIKKAGHSRIPVFKGTIDSIVGILYAKDILSWISNNPNKILEKEWDLQTLLKKPYFIPESKMVDDLMADLKKNHLHMAIVVDEYGGTAGIVTMEDILEEIVGEIKDEYDLEEDPVIKISENCYHVNPHIELDDLAKEIDVILDLDEPDYNTLGGLIYHEHGDLPKTGTTIEFNGLHLKVLGMNGQRIEKVEITVVRDIDKPIDLKEAF